MAIFSRNSVKVDASGLNAHLQDYAKLMGKEMSVVIREQAGLFCRDMIGFTRPFNGSNKGGTGASKKAQLYGQENVRKSVFKVFQPIWFATSSQIGTIGSYEVFQAWDKARGEKGENVGGNRITWKQFQQKYPVGGGSAKYISLSSTGQVRSIMTGYRTDGGRGPLQDAVRKQKEAFIVTKDVDILNAYIKEEGKNVGTLKSAYWFAAQRINAKISAPAWAKNPAGSSNAIAQDKTNVPLTPEVTVGNVIGNKLNNQNWTKHAINVRASKMRIQMANYMNKNKIPLWNATSTWGHFSIK
jgi:hypothetical protein